MKLTVFNAENTPKNSFREGKPKIGFAKAGTISFNRGACELMELTVGDKIAIAQNEEDPASWYVFKCADGFELRGKELDKTFSLTFNHTALRNVFFDAFQLDTSITRNFEIAKEPVEEKEGKKVIAKYYYIKVPVETTEVD